MRKYRKGDLVSVTGRVRHDFREDSEYVHIDIDGAIGSAAVLDPEKVHLVAPHIDPGREVELNGRPGVVVASSGKFLWVQVDDGKYDTWIAKAVRVKGDEEGPTTARGAIKEMAEAAEVVAEDGTVVKSRDGQVGRRVPRHEAAS